MKRDTSRVRQLKLAARCRATDLGLREVAVLQLLAAHESFDETTRESVSFPSIDLLAVDLCCDRNTVRAGLAALLAAGIITRRTGRRGGREFFVYVMPSTDLDPSPYEAAQSAKHELVSRRRSAGETLTRERVHSSPVPAGETVTPCAGETASTAGEDLTRTGDVGAGETAHSERVKVETGAGETVTPKYVGNYVSEQRSEEEPEPQTPALTAPVPPAAPLKLSPVDAPAPKPKRVPKPKPVYTAPLAFEPAVAIGYATETSAGRIVAGPDTTWPKAMFVTLSGLIRVHRTAEPWRALGAWLAAGGDAYKGAISTGELSSSTWLPGALAKAAAWDAAGRGPIDDRRPSAPRKGPLPPAPASAFAEATAANRVITRDPVADAARRRAGAPT